MERLRHKSRRWVMCHAVNGMYLGDITSEELASGLEELARAIRKGSDLVPDFPPPLELEIPLGNGKSEKVPFRLRRADIGKLEPVRGEVPIVQ